MASVSLSRARPTCGPTATWRTCAWSTTPGCTTGMPHGSTPRSGSMKSTKAEIRRRVNEVVKLRLGGAELPDIREYANAPEQGWTVSDAQVWRYIRAADAL